MFFKLSHLIMMFVAGLVVGIVLCDLTLHAQDSGTIYDYGDMAIIQGDDGSGGTLYRYDGYSNFQGNDGSSGTIYNYDGYSNYQFTPPALSQNPC